MEDPPPPGDLPDPGIKPTSFTVARQNPKDRIRRRVVRRGAAAVGDVYEARWFDFRMFRNINEWRSEVRSAMSIRFPVGRMKWVVRIELLHILYFAVALHDRKLIIAKSIQQRR